MERNGYGTDISSWRRDDLDALAIAKVSAIENCRAMDLCCGKGAMAAEFLKVGAEVTAWDKIIPQILFDGDCLGPWEVIVRDILDPVIVPHRAPFDVIVWQRAIHYLKPKDAGFMVRRVLETKSCCLGTVDRMDGMIS